MENLVKQAANRFGHDAFLIESLTEGHIHKTYKVKTAEKSIILQQVNTSVFKNPESIIENYHIISAGLDKNTGITIPVMIKTPEGRGLWLDNDGSCWRAFEFIEDSYTEKLPATAEIIFSAAQCYGVFVRSLLDLDSKRLTPTIQGFHDLNNRYNQLHQAINTATPLRLNKSNGLLKKIEARKSLVDFYNGMVLNPEFKLRTMHHDCKLSNILFDSKTNQAICPIDLDTTMPGYFFSDIGDMVRSMVSGSGESESPESITLQKDSYRAIVSGYQSGIGNAFTKAEQSHIHHSGLLMIYMQGIRFLCDYLSNDVYYKTSYPEQNFDRAANQLALLEKVEEFLEADYHYTIR